MSDFDTLLSEAFRKPTPEQRELAKHSHTYARRKTLPPPLRTLARWQGIQDFGKRQEQWSPKLALANLEVREVDFDPEVGGPRCHGYALGHDIAIHPHTPNPLRVVMHELGHVALGHTFGRSRGDRKRPLREIQAEAAGFAVMSLIGAISPLSVATARSYIHDYRYWLDEPFLDAQADQVREAALNVWDAGRETT